MRDASDTKGILDKQSWSLENIHSSLSSQAKKQGYITISVDDGHPLDQKVAELLYKLGFKATFYVPAHNPERLVMSPNEMVELATEFEFGSHTLNHKPLKHLKNQVAASEINDGKKWLEDVIGKRVVAFCYPNGKFHSATSRLVKEAGFLGARTCLFNLNGFPRDPFLWGVSTQGYSHSVSVQIRHALLERNFQGISNFIAIHQLARDWCAHFRYAVDYVEKYGGIAHLYFHSWEIDEQGQWPKLQSLLEHFAQNTKLTRVTNGDLFQLWHSSRPVEA